MMNVFRIFLTLTIVALTTIPVAAQNAVQLPTLSSFRTNTTVSVPDRGSVYTGGINRAADGRNEFGTPLLPLRNRSIGSQRSASSVWTSVYIHDFEAMDEALLSQARGSAYRAPVHRSLARSPMAVAGSRPLPGQSQTARTTWQSRAAPRPTTGPMSKSVSQLRAERFNEQQARVAEAEHLFERGKTAEAKGKLNVARIYYQQASRRAQGPLQQEILAQLRLVSTPSVAQQ
jgi:hypothetical protein